MSFYSTAGLAQLIGAHRILFGSNAPLEHPYVKRVVVESEITGDEDRELILRQNIVRILKI